MWAAHALHMTDSPYEKTSEYCYSEVSRLVRLAGIEPTTPWFVAKYSIQLSYSRIGGEGGIRTHGTLRYA